MSKADQRDLRSGDMPRIESYASSLSPIALAKGLYRRATYKHRKKPTRNARLKNLAVPQRHS